MDTHYVTRLEDRVHSTQDVARTQFAAAHDGVPVLVVAKRQDAGRGRHDNLWWSSPRAMLASVAVALEDLEHATLVPLTAGMAAHDAIESQLGVKTTLKWPNDVMLGEDKVGGILAELSGATLVVGCGLNLWWPESPAGAIALADHDPGDHTAMELAHDWTGRLLAALGDLPGSFDKGRYQELCATIGRHITWLPEGEGRAVGVSADGALLVATAHGQKTLRSGEVSHIRPATMPADNNQ